MLGYDIDRVLMKLRPRHNVFRKENTRVWVS